ncbi:CinA family protein [Azoarcus sp. KH32C]|uniref:CinA family protein n=1 Tax=Azoarcus sp. KH32C TaxID=748247 RepID=UPI0002386E17|nr:nicotinamide-nucleotide amidohydrolase family protein [Azoarcus sp. KH32C]BAL26598.1 CinA-related protein [Azoarcus sp. KH32C]
MDPHLNALSAEVGAWLLARKLKLGCAESCTGGWVAEVVTATAGSSEWFDCGFITYSNESKQELLDVPADTLRRHGAVSEPTVGAMVAGVLSRSRADVVLAVSGIAGPGGGSPDKPVGTVCFAWGARDGRTHCATCHFSGDREAVRRQAVFHALRELMTMDFS